MSKRAGGENHPCAVFFFLKVIEVLNWGNNINDSTTVVEGSVLLVQWLIQQEARGERCEVVYAWVKGMGMEMEWREGEEK